MINPAISYQPQNLISRDIRQNNSKNKIRRIVQTIPVQVYFMLMTIMAEQ